MSAILFNPDAEEYCKFHLNMFHLHHTKLSTLTVSSSLSSTWWTKNQTVFQMWKLHCQTIWDCYSVPDLMYLLKQIIESKICNILDRDCGSFKVTKESRYMLAKKSLHLKNILNHTPYTFWTFAIWKAKTLWTLMNLWNKILTAILGQKIYQ